MPTIGFATLEVIPSMRGLRSALERQSSGDMTAAGRTGGRRFGDAAGTQAGTSFKSKIGGALKDFNPLAGLAIGAGIATFLKGSLDEAREAATVGKQTEAVIKSTGGAAGVSAGQVADLAAALSQKVGVDDEAIQSGANLLLTFKDIKDEAGSGNDIFSQATQTILDMSTAMGTDLKSSAIQVGKALNDPVKGMSALSRSGVTFSDSQKAMITAMTKSGDKMGAQKIILGELTTEFGGAAAAGHDAGDKLQVAFGNLMESVGTQLLPIFNSLASFITDKGIPALEAIGGAVGGAVTWFGKLPGPVKVAVGAFVLLRASASLGLGTALAGAISTTVGSLTGLYLKLGMGVQNFRTARISSGLFAASLGAVRGAALLAGAALKSAFMTAGPLIAIVAITTVISKFWAAQQEAKQHVDDLTASMDAQTGAVTGNTKALQAKSLEDKGILLQAQSLGLSLDDVTAAASGQEDAFARLNTVLQASIKYDADHARGTAENTQPIQQVIDLLREEAGATDTASAAAKRIAAGMGKAATATGDAATATGKAGDAMKDAGKKTKTMADEVDGARKAIRKLIDAEDDRKAAFGEQKASQLDLIDAMREGRKEANKGKKTLDENTLAGEKNWRALLNMSDTWNDMPKKQQNAKGAFAKMREDFIKTADKMGYTRKQAEKLADRILEVPKTAPLHFQSTGYKKTLSELQTLREQIRLLKLSDVVLNIRRIENKPHAGEDHAPRDSGGPHPHHPNRPRSGDSPGGAGLTAGGSGSGVQVNIGNVTAHDYRDFMGQMQGKARQAALGGMPV